MRQKINWFKVVTFGTLGCLLNIQNAVDRRVGAHCNFFKDDVLSPYSLNANCSAISSGIRIVKCLCPH